MAPSGLEHGVNPGMTKRLYLLQSPVSPGTTLAIEVDDVKSANRLDGYSKVIEGFRFGD